MSGSSSVRGDQTIYHTDNLCFDGTDRGAPMAINGQLWIGSTASNRPDNGGHVRLGQLTSPNNTITIGYSAPNITLDISGGSTAIDSIDVQSNTAPGTDPVLPTALGLITVNGAAVANHSVVLETHSRAANAYNLEIQYATSAAATDATKSGVAHFNSAQFTVDANGFVSASGTVPIQFTADSGTAAPAAGNINILGGPGVTTSASGSTVTINSVVYTDQAGSTSVTSDSGSFATAAITLTLPATPAQGELCEFVATSAAVLVVDAPSTHLIRIANAISSAGGTASSSGLAGDSLTLRYRSSDTTWYATSVIGVWITA